MLGGSAPRLAPPKQSRSLAEEMKPAAAPFKQPRSMADDFPALGGSAPSSSRQQASAQPAPISDSAKAANKVRGLLFSVLG